MFKKLRKLKKGDKVAIVSPSYSPRSSYREIFDICLDRLKGLGLKPIVFDSSIKSDPSTKLRGDDLVKAFEDDDIKAVIATIGGDDQITYVNSLPEEVFKNNPKPFFGYSDNTHFINFLWKCGIPSYYGFCLFSQTSMPIDGYTLKYINKAMFENKNGFYEVNSSHKIVDTVRTKNGFDWSHGERYISDELVWEDNAGYLFGFPESFVSTDGILWGGCLESIDDILRQRIGIPDLPEFKNIILYLETSEELPSHHYTKRVVRALGALGYLNNIKGLLVGRPQGSSFDIVPNLEYKKRYRIDQFRAIETEFRKYNKTSPIIGNVDFGHTKPQICIPSGKRCRIDMKKKRLVLSFEY